MLRTGVLSPQRSSGSARPVTAQRTHDAGRFNELGTTVTSGSPSMPWRYSGVMAGKYGRLCEHLRALQETEWRASFAEIEEVLGLDLPASARSHAAWWSNDGGHSQARAWLDAGFRTSESDTSRRTVLFRRVVADRSREPTVQPPRRRAARPRKRAERPAGPSIA